VSWTGNSYTDGPVTEIVSTPTDFASGYAPMAGANPSGLANPSLPTTSGFFTKDVTVIGWIDAKAITFPAQGSVNSLLVAALNNSTTCFGTVLSWTQGDRVLITDDIDRQYANAYLLAYSANQQPPSTITSSALTGGDFRAYNDSRVWINLKNNQISNPVFSGAGVALGHTPDACHSSIAEQFNQWGNDVGIQALAPQAHPDNGTDGTTPDQLHVFQLAEGRVGTFAQAANMTLNWCTTKNMLGICTTPVPPVTPYIWAYPVFDTQGNYTMNTQIFPTYSIYEDGKLVNTIPQTYQENFIQLQATSPNGQVKAADIK
jgi:hypothetical protein